MAEVINVEHLAIHGGVLRVPEGCTELTGSLAGRHTCLHTVLFPESLCVLGNDVFTGSSKLKNVKLPPYLQTIGSHAFSGCEGLERIVIPSGVKRVTFGAFGACLSLEGVCIKNGVESIEDESFADCWSLQRVVLPQSVKWISDTAFKNSRPTMGKMDFRIYAEPSSYAAEYAVKHDITYIPTMDANL